MQWPNLRKAPDVRRNENEVVGSEGGSKTAGDNGSATIKYSTAW